MGVGTRRHLRPWLMAASLFGLSCMNAAVADGGYEKEAPAWAYTALEDVAPVTDAVYKRVCGGCHFAYAPGLLPARSWEQLLAGMADHFGEKVELSRGERNRVTNYVLNNAAGRVPHPLSRKIMDSLGPLVPLRVTEVPPIRDAHAGLPAGAVKDNPAVGSLGDCGACHPRALEGYFTAGEALIPGRQ